MRRGRSCRPIGVRREGDIIIHVILPAFRPNPSWLEIQLRSILAQSGVSVRVWLCPDGPEAAAGIAVSAGDGRIEALSFETRVGVLANVERGLEAALAASGPGDLFAFADQDDFWHADKLTRGVAAMPRVPIAAVAHDARVIGAEGALVAPSLNAYERRHGQLDQLSLLIANTVSGMTMMATREAIRAALPFPTAIPHLLHDWWLALVVSGAGRIGWIDAALVDYRQHERNVIGARQAGSPLPFSLPPLRPFLGSRYRQMALEAFAQRRQIALELHSRNLLAAPASAFFLARSLRPLLRSWRGNAARHVIRCGVGMVLS